jgi:hypothetical protein
LASVPDLETEREASTGEIIQRSAPMPVPVGRIQL